MLQTDMTPPPMYVASGEPWLIRFGRVGQMSEVTIISPTDIQVRSLRPAVEDALKMTNIEYLKKIMNTIVTVALSCIVLAAKTLHIRRKNDTSNSSTLLYSLFVVPPIYNNYKIQQ